MRKLSGLIGVICVAVAGIMLATGQTGTATVVLIVVGLLALLVTVGGAAGAW